MDYINVNGIKIPMRMININDIAKYYGVSVVKLGHRIIDDDGNMSCSECGGSECWGNYCMNCGAKME